MDPDSAAPPSLVAKLIARILHDIAGPTFGLTTALESLGDAADEGFRLEAVSLAKDSLEQLTSRIAFFRAAFGGGPEVATFETLAQTPFAHARASLNSGNLPAGSPQVLGQGLLVLSQIAAESLSSGGTARMGTEQRDGTWHGVVEAEHPRVRLNPETALGLEGGGPGPGLSGRWAPARYLHDLIIAHGGSVSHQVEAGIVRFTLSCPA